MTLQAGRIYGGVGRLGAARQGGATPWWLSGGIAAANCVAAYQPKGAASYAASKVNLANPGTYDAVEGVAPTWSAANGWAFTGAQNLATGLTIQNASGYTALVRIAGASMINYAFGWDGSGVRFFVGVFASSRDYGFGGYATSSGSITSAVLGIGGGYGWLNGSKDKAISGWSGTNSAPLKIGCLVNQLGTTINSFRGNILAFVIFNTTLTDSQMLSVSASINLL